MYKRQVVFITRINSEKANYLLNLYDNGRFYEEANCLIIGKNLNRINTNKKVAIISGGSSDLAVTLEAQLALEILWVELSIFYRCWRSRTSSINESVRRN